MISGQNPDKANILIAIERSGVFPVGWLHSHDHQCGNVGTSVLNYRVRITALQCNCDSHGYILDNNDIPEYFEERYKQVKDFQSCEHIAAAAVKELFDSCSLNGVVVKSIEVGVTGIPGSWITASWRSRPAVNYKPPVNSGYDLSRHRHA